MILSPRKLLDKLLITCPNVEHCREVLPRRDLQLHLIYRCKGTVMNCVNANYGCSFRSARGAIHKHLETCAYQKELCQSISCGGGGGGRGGAGTTLPICDEQITTLEIYKGDGRSGRERGVRGTQRGEAEDPGRGGEGGGREGENRLGISIVGGLDTPLISVIVQEVQKNSLASRDGRLLPGDQLLEVNGIDLTRTTHHQAVLALSRPCITCRLVIYREPSDDDSPQTRHRTKQQILHVTLPKLPGKQLGIKLIQKKIVPGLFILEIISGGIAFWDNRLQHNDQIMEINGENLSNGCQERAVELIQQSVDVVNLVVSRSVTTSLTTTVTHTVTPLVLAPSRPPSSSSSHSGGSTVTSLDSCCGSASDGEYDYHFPLPPPPPLHLPPPPPLPPVGQEKIINIIDDDYSSLGLGLGGGRCSGGYDTPLYISRLHVRRNESSGNNTPFLQKSQVLLSVNGLSLINLTRHEAERQLTRITSTDRHLVFRVVEGPTGQHQEEEDIDEDIFEPSWKFWLVMPTVCYSPKTISLERSVSGSLGFSIVGGYTGSYGDVPVFVKSVVHNGPAGRDGRLRSGDRILSVNGISLDGVTHGNAALLLTANNTNTVTLTVVSWPGSSI